MSNDKGASVRARLLAIAKAGNSVFEAVLVRFALERLLYRLSISPHSDRFVLKGALLFNLWYDMPHRTTRDTDLLGFGPSDLESLRQVFAEVASIDADDGIFFNPSTVTAEEIRHDANYAGARVLIESVTAKARCKSQVDIGFGDIVIPGPVLATYPVLLSDLPAPSLKTYPVYTVIAEKFHAIVMLGMNNSRLKDYLDLWVLLTRESLDPNVLAESIAATFARRDTTVPTNLPIGLVDEFAEDKTRQALWRRFLEKNQLDNTPLLSVIQAIRTELSPAIVMASQLIQRQ